MKLFIFSLIGLCVTGATAFAGRIHKEPYFVKGHDTIVHLFEWKWSDIANECETFLGPKGFGGVQISPVQENVIISSRPWWERYQPVSYKLISRSGSENELKDMVKRCNKAGVRIYVDIIINHMCGDQFGEVTGVGGSRADPPSRNYYNVPFTKADFNEFCTVTSYEDPRVVRNCELFGLHDLNQGVENVREAIVNFMNAVIDLGVAGFRVDAAKHMWPGDLTIIYSRLNNLSMNHGFPKGARPFIYQEVIDGGSVSTSEYDKLGAITEFKYPTELNNGIRGRNPLKYFRNFGEEWGFTSSDNVVVFVDNHDTQRGGYLATSITYKEPKLYKMAVAFMLAHPYGTPLLMSSFTFDNRNTGPPADSRENLLSPEIRDDGSCGGGWVCEHRWRQIYNMVGFRNAVNKSSISEWWDNWNNQIAFSRGNAGFIAINADSSHLKMNIHTQLPAGKYCDIITGNRKNGKCTGKTVVVDKTGHASIEILVNDEDGILAIHKNAKLKNAYDQME